jgi:RHS repeat-associated protein
LDGRQCVKYPCWGSFRRSGRSSSGFGSDVRRTIGNLRFPGQIYDSQAGLQQNYFRDYDPAIGRCLESDPIGITAGINTYAYVGGNPTSFVDTLGLTQQDIDQMTCFARQNNLDMNIPTPAVEDIPDYAGFKVEGYVGPWPWSTPAISSMYLAPLDAAEVIDLYNTIVHESWHYDKQPFYDRSGPVREQEAQNQAKKRTAAIENLIKQRQIGTCGCLN